MLFIFFQLFDLMLKDLMNFQVCLINFVLHY